MSVEIVVKNESRFYDKLVAVKSFTFLILLLLISKWNNTRVVTLNKQKTSQRKNLMKWKIKIKQTSRVFPKYKLKFKLPRLDLMLIGRLPKPWQNKVIL